jgi:mannose-6-phosphate isomerase
VLVERVWGVPTHAAAILSLYPGAARAGRSRIGEVWLTGDDSPVVNGAHAGQTLGELARSSGALLLGSRGLQHPSGEPTFPLLVKFLFTTDRLSVQVHPPDAVARRKGSWGKTEMWHILHAEPGAQLAVGFRKHLPETASTPQALRQAAADGAIEQMLDWQEVHAGETYFVPAGTVHAIGGGITLCEIQQNSDITYRLYDYNRPGTDGLPRALHLNEALEVIDWQTPGGRTQPAALSTSGGAYTLLAACPYFATERWELRRPLRFNSRRMELWVGLEGRAEFEACGDRAVCGSGDVAVIPADAVGYSVRPLAPSAFLRTYCPDWEKDIAVPLRAAGFDEAHRRRVAFPLTDFREGAGA